MRITAGLGQVDQLRAYAQAGADEVFCGYVPEHWTARWGLDYPLNRREVRCCPVQIGGRNELRLLRALSRDCGIEVSLTFNSPCYHPDQLPEALGIIQDCMAEGFTQFIAADPALIMLLHERGLTRQMHLHVSGEAGELNRFVLRQWCNFGAERIILHRKLRLEEMAALAAAPVRPPELEAFMMNEMCHFHGAFCASLHCDELAHMCHVPWQLAPLRDAPGARRISAQGYEMPDVPGAGGCGLCALPYLRDIGVTHLKVVGRGADAEEMVRDIRTLRQALDLLNTCPADEWQARMRTACFPDGCGGVCYYP